MPEPPDAVSCSPLIAVPTTDDCAAGGVALRAVYTVQLNGAVVAVAPAWSVTRTVMPENVVAGVPMVPVMRPVLEIASPLGGVPPKAYVHGVFAQLVVSCRLTLLPTVLAWLPGAVTVGLAATTQVKATVLLVLPSLTVIETLEVPVAVGVPVIRPLELIDRPAGNVRGESLQV